jgi:hypothetical protein
LKENEAAMIKMMNDMEIKPTGDIDRDFVAMTSPSPSRRDRHGDQRNCAETVTNSLPARACRKTCPRE